MKNLERESVKFVVPKALGHAADAVLGEARHAAAEVDGEGKAAACLPEFERTGKAAATNSGETSSQVTVLRLFGKVFFQNFYALQ